jgi:hypothetical protein
VVGGDVHHVVAGGAAALEGLQGEWQAARGVAIVGQCHDSGKLHFTHSIHPLTRGHATQPATREGGATVWPSWYSSQGCCLHNTRPLARKVVLTPLDTLRSTISWGSSRGSPGRGISPSVTSCSCQHGGKHSSM